MIWYIMAAYNCEKQKTKKKNKLSEISKRRWIGLGLAGISIFFFFVSWVILMPIYEIFWLGNISIFTVILSFLYLSRIVSTESDENYKKNTAEYKNQLNRFKKMLASDCFQIYTGEQIERLLREFEYIIPSLKISSKIYKPFITLFAVCIFPITTICLSSILGKLPLNANLIFLEITVLGFLGLFCIYNSAVPILNKYFDSTYETATEIRQMLADIILVEQQYGNNTKSK